MRFGLGIITHNRLPVIKECIPTALDQKPDFTVIIDNASKEPTKGFLRSLLNLHSQIRFIFNSKNQFPGFARNQIVEELAHKVDVIIFHDGDVLVHPQTFKLFKNIFMLAPQISQITPLSIPEFFQKNAFHVDNIGLCEPISCCSGCMTAIRSEIFKSGISWRSSKWMPYENQEIGEDYFISRDILRADKKIVWLERDSHYTSHHLGRDSYVINSDIGYYLETFGRRGMLSRLKEILPEKQEIIDVYAQQHHIPEVHGNFSIFDSIFDKNLLKPLQKDKYNANYERRLNLFKDIECGKKKPAENDLDKIKSARDYFDSIEDGHPFFSQESLQATIYFNKMYLKHGGIIKNIDI